MYKLVIYTTQDRDLSTWSTWLESDFEITQISNKDSIQPLIKTWEPHLFIYFCEKIEMDILKEIRSLSKNLMGTIVLAPKYDLTQEILAYQMLVDYYILIKSPIQSIKARLNSLAQKVTIRHLPIKNHSEVGLPKNQTSYSFNDIKVYSNQNLVSMNSKLIKLTPTETQLLILLITNQNTVLSREVIKTQVFNQSLISTRTIDAHMAKLKKKLVYIKPFIESVYGVGYVLRNREILIRAA